MDLPQFLTTLQVIDPESGTYCFIEGFESAASEDPCI